MQLNDGTLDGKERKTPWKNHQLPINPRSSGNTRETPRRWKTGKTKTTYQRQEPRGEPIIAVIDDRDVLKKSLPFAINTDECDKRPTGTRRALDADSSYEFRKKFTAHVNDSLYGYPDARLSHPRTVENRRAETQDNVNIEADEPVLQETENADKLYEENH